LLKKTEVKPFRGLRYHPEKITDLSDVITPPYDVITPEAQRNYHDKDPDNSIRLELGFESDTDSDEENRYTRAAQQLKDWLDAGVLQAEAKPALYWCREEFVAPDGSEAIREGFLAALGLVDFSEGVVLPHEHTSPGPKADRLALMTATEANLSPIFCLYSDPKHDINAMLKSKIDLPPDAMATDEAGTKHSLWVIDDDGLISAIGDFMGERTLMIADGHHRYETALAYRDERRHQDASSEPQPYEYMMVYLSNTDNPGMTIFPLHRMVSGLDSETLDNLTDRLKKDFEVELMPKGAGMEALLQRMVEHGSTHNTFGLHLSETDESYLLTALHPKPMLDAGEDNLSPAFRSLDSAVLDRVILAGILDIAPGGANENASVSFAEQAEIDPEEIASLDHQLMILVNATTMDEVKAVSEAGEKMPKKSTYFYPKPVTGLVFRSFNY
jgi:uncharacterized protein (DUF1015 family)